MDGSEALKSPAQAKIIEAAAGLLQEHGPAALTTRRVADAAGVQPPAIYRAFGDKDGLLDAVAEHVMATFAASKAALVDAASAGNVDPLDDLRAGWRSQIAFGVANPTLFRLLSDPARVAHSPAAESGRRVLQARVRRVAAIGRLRVSEQRAVGLIQAAGIGAIHALLAMAPEQRDPELAEAMYDAVLAQILADVPEPPQDAPLAAAVAMRAVAPGLSMLSGAERQLLDDWLDRVIDALESRDGR